MPDVSFGSIASSAPEYITQVPTGAGTDDGSGNFPNLVPGVNLNTGEILSGGANALNLNSSGLLSDATSNVSSLANSTLSGLAFGSDTTDTSTLPRTVANPGSPGHINTGSKYGFRHFTFVLSDQTQNTVTSLDLNFNPEDLTYETPYRVFPIQTAGGIFVDVWGQGIRKIVLRGHTGWRTVQTPTQQQDGFDNLFSLRDVIIDHYFSARDTASLTLSQTDVASQITLTIVDRLHQVAYNVVPEVFRLLRNRQRPLLHMYEASFIIVDEVTNNSPSPVIQDAQQQNQQMSGLFGALASQFGSLGAQASAIGGSFGSAMSSLTNLGGGISGVFQGLLSAKQQFTQGVNGITGLVTQATQAVNSGLGIINSFVDFSQLAIDAKQIFYDVKSTFAALNCILNQVKDGGLFVYTGIVGSSYCGTLSAGTLSPLMGSSNTFDTLQNPNGSTNVGTISSATQAITPTAQQLSQNINSIDGAALLIGRS